jgi:hypothetical protein
MTIAVDIKTGAVVGQVTAVRTRPVYGSDIPAPDAATQPWKIVLLTRDGEYRTVPAETVRLETLR